MKKLATFVFALLLCASLSFAQAGGGSTGDSGKSDTTTKGKKHDHGKKGGKKEKEPTKTPVGKTRSTMWGHGKPGF